MIFLLQCAADVILSFALLDSDPENYLTSAVLDKYVSLKLFMRCLMDCTFLYADTSG